MFVKLIFLLFSSSLFAQDCSERVSPTTCTGMHETEQCFWHCEKSECIGSTPGDRQHICGEMCNPTDCRNKGGCCWDEGKCQEVHDVENPAACPPPDAFTGVGSSTSTQSGSGSTSIQSGSGSTSIQSGSGSTSTQSGTGSTSTQSGSGSSSTQSGSSGSSTQSGSSGSSTQSGSSGSSTQSGSSSSSSQSGSSSNSYTPSRPVGFYKCELYDHDPGTCDSMEHCIYKAGNIGEEGECDEIEGFDHANLDCETYTTPETCKNKQHDGQICRWSCNAQDCEESNLNDMEHICGQHCTAATCAGQVGCFWDPNGGDYGECQELSSLVLSKPHQVVVPDCETYSKAECDGTKYHEGKQCLWSCEDRACEESNPGDMEHICDSRCTQEECSGASGCGWDMTEMRCAQCSDINDGLPPCGFSFAVGDTGVAFNFGLITIPFSTSTSSQSTTTTTSSTATSTSASTSSSTSTATSSTSSSTSTSTTTSSATSTSTTSSADSNCIPGGMCAISSDDLAELWNLVLSEPANQQYLLSSNLDNIGMPTSGRSQVVQGTNYEFEFSDGTVVSVYQDLLQKMEITSHTPGSASTDGTDTGLDTGDTGLDTGGTGLDTGGSGLDTGGLPNLPVPRDCEEYLNADDCNGQMHEGKACYWSLEGQECDEATPGDPEHYCPTLKYESICNAQQMCGWVELYESCASLDDYEPDCEMYTSPEDCAMKFHEGKVCFWNVGKCDERDPTDVTPGSGCLAASTESDCTQSGCLWDASTETCSSTGGVGGGAGGIEQDCEMYTSQATCTGKMHDGKQCFWKAEKSDCEEGEPGDPEKVCGQYGTLETCPSGCAFIENKCQPPSTLQLRKSRPNVVTNTTHDWSYYAWFTVFILGNVILGVICALVVRYVFCNKQQPNESYVNLDHLEANLA